ncbi:MAG: LCP family protein [Antricoccus sp.]
MSEDELPEQLTVAELLARYGGDLPARPRRRRAAPETDDPAAAPGDAGSTADVSTSAERESDQQTAAESWNDPAPESAAAGADTEPLAQEPARVFEPQSGSEFEPDLSPEDAPKPGSDFEAESVLATAGEPISVRETESASGDDPALVQDPDFAAMPAEQESETESTVGSRSEPAAARPRKSLWQRRGSIRALMIVGIVAALVAAYYVVILFVAQSQIARADVLRPNSAEIIDAAAQQGVDNYLLVIGDQSGAAAGAQITALAHVSADGASLVIVSFPRQTIVDVPPCGTKASSVAPFTGTLEQAFAKGGARCSIAAVQEATGIRINHYIGIDLQRFDQVINAVGGVTLCLRESLKDPKIGLSLPAGRNTLDGAQGTEYVRAVDSASGNDPQRASRQIDFLTKLFDKILSTQTVLNPVRLTKLAFATAHALTLDPDTSLGQLRTLAELFAANSAKVAIVVPPMSGTQIAVSGSSVMGTRIADVTGRNLFDSIIANQQLPSTVEVGQTANDSTQGAGSQGSAATASSGASDPAPSPAVC